MDMDHGHALLFGLAVCAKVLSEDLKFPSRTLDCNQMIIAAHFTSVVLMLRPFKDFLSKISA